MTRPILLLVRLNDADLALDTTKARLAEIVEAARKSAELLRAEEALVAAEKEVTRLRAELSEVEREQADAEAKIKTIEAQLYDGKTTRSRDLENSQRDLAQHRNQKAAVEDRLLELMVAMEAANAAHGKAQAVAKRLTAEWAGRQSGLRAEHAKLKARLPNDQARVAAAREGVPAALLRTYDHLRPRHGGRAVAELDGDTCSMCRVQAPPSKIAAARFDDELVYCDNCGRLLWGE